MTENKSSEREALDRLAEALITDILNASDEEILEDIREEGKDPAQLATEMLKLFEKSVLVAKKARLADARAAVTANKAMTNNQTSKPPLSIEEARQRLNSIQSNPNDPRNLTLAARKESELSDSDIINLVSDIERLWFIQQDDEDTKRS